MKEKLNQFLTYLDSEKDAPLNTIFSYERDLKQFLNYLKQQNISLEDVGHIVIRDFLKTLHKRNLKKSSVYNKICAIKTFFKFCKKKSWIKTNPAKKIEFPRYASPVPSFLTERETEKFMPLPIIALRDYAILEFLYATGVRVSELTNININDISFKNNAILIRGEGRKKRSVYFGRKAARSLMYYLKARPLLIPEGSKENACFLNHMGERITMRTVERIVEKYWLLSGLENKITPRSFRHSFAAHLLGRGADSNFVQELLGHKKLVSTKRYFRISIEHLKLVYKKYHPRSAIQVDIDSQSRRDGICLWSCSSLIRF